MTGSTANVIYLESPAQLAESWWLPVVGPESLKLRSHCTLPDLPPLKAIMKPDQQALQIRFLKDDLTAPFGRYGLGVTPGSHIGSNTVRIQQDQPVGHFS